MADLPKRLGPVAMEAESGCSRCPRKILLLEKAFLDERYAAVCVHCAADAYSALRASVYLNTHEIGPGDMPDE